MISIIVCSRLDPSNNLHERNISKTIDAEFEYIRIDNRNNSYNLCSAYNEGVRRSTGETVVFIHEDVFFMEGGWGKKLEGKFSDQTIGLVGVAGTQYLFSDSPGWVAAGRPFIKGQVVHETNDGNTYNLTVFSWENEDTEVVAVDGLFFAIRRSLFGTIKFDEQTFDGFHLYDLDICMQIRRTHRLIVTKEILLKHQSGGNFNNIWQTYALRFLNKYKNELPASCTTITPDKTNRVPFENFDLKGKVAQITIQ
jgi:glycosyltransferase involved in cell wall biosynthesis